jgi:hypothetical protein
VSKSENEILLLRAAVQRLHHCKAAHLKTVFVDERFEGKTVWQGEVEVFELTGHPKSEGCFAWFHYDTANGQQPDSVVALLNRWPVNSPHAAVRFSIAFDIPVVPLAEVMPIGVDLNPKESGKNFSSDRPGPRLGP